MTLATAGMGSSAQAAAAGAPGTTESSTLARAALAPSLGLVKTANPTSVAAVGETVTYTYAVTNTGDETIENIVVTDVMDPPAGPAPTVSCPFSTLAPADSMSCTGSAYTVTQADLDNGLIDNTATASGVTDAGDTVTSPQASETVLVDVNPELTLAKSANPASFSAAGQLINYTYTLTNTGNVTIGGFAVTDTMTAPAGPSPTVDCPNTTLAPGGSLDCTATYTVTQADVNNGSIGNEAIAEGATPFSTEVVSNTATLTITAILTGVLTITKSATPTSVSAVDEEINYTYTLNNTGTEELTNIAVTDTMTAPAGPSPAVSCPSTTLAAGAMQDCTATYTVTQADLDNGSIANSATATTTTPGGTPVSAGPATQSVSVAVTTGVSIEKQASPLSVSAVGETVNYTFTVTNEGNVTLNNVSVTDTMTPPAGPSPAVSCPSTTLAGGAVQDCTATYTVTQADLDNGSIANSATATGTSPQGVTTTSVPDTITVSVTNLGGLSMTKTANPTSVSTVGETVTYTFTVTNNNNAAVTGLSVSDTMDPPAGPSPTVSCPNTTIAAGTSQNCTAMYTVTQADLDNGSIGNTAIASATRPDGVTVTSEVETATVTVAGSTGLSLAKVSDVAVVDAVGDTVTYTFTVTNTGTVPLTGVSVTDTMTPPAGPSPTVSCPSTTLAAGAMQDCTATYTVTQADLDNGSIANSATARGTTPGGATVTSAPATTTVQTATTGRLVVAKSANPQSVDSIGDTVTYTYTVTNLTNVVLVDIAVTDTMTPPAGPSPTVSCPSTTLAAGAMQNCTATYTVTQADLDNGSIANSAVATGTQPDGSPLQSAEATAAVTVIRAAGLSVAKTAVPASVSTAGQQVTYTFTVRNTGTVTINDIEVTDTMTPPAGPSPTVTCPGTSLDAGETQDCTATYTVTQADLDHGSIDNSAVASGTTADGRTVRSEPATFSVDVAAPPVGQIALTKSHRVVDVNRNGRTDRGDRIVWIITVRNTGTVTVTDIEVNDPSAGPVDCPRDTLEPGDSQQCTVAAHVITARDVKKGKVVNVATATGTTPGGPVTSGPVEDTVKVSGYYGGPGRPAEDDAELPAEPGPDLVSADGEQPEAN